MNIFKALQCRGWMTEDELGWLAVQAEKYKTIVEIGSYQGRATRAMGDSTNGTVFAVDDWRGLREPWWVEQTNEAERNSLFERFMQNVADLIPEKVVPVRSNHDDVHPFEADMVFIDGDHTYESVTRDIEKWFPCTNKLICGHDADQYPVMKAVQDILPEAKQVVGLIWACEV